MVYCLGTTGMLTVMKVADGARIWSLSIVERFGGEVPRWGMAVSVLVEGNMIIASPGGKDACIVALDKHTRARSGLPKDRVTRRDMRPELPLPSPVCGSSFK